MKIFKEIKENIYLIVFLLLLTFNFLIVNFSFPLKYEIVILSFFIIIILFCILCFKMGYSFLRFLVIDEDEIKIDYSKFLTLLSCFSFLLLSVLINLNEVKIARYVLLVFIILVLFNGVFFFYDLEKKGNKFISRFWFFLLSVISIVYFVVSAIAASFFMKISNMDITNSPFLELIWTFSSMVFIFFLVLQPLLYIFFLKMAGKLKGSRFITPVLLLAAATIVLSLVLRWIPNFMVLALDISTDYEWRVSAHCGQLEISEPQERYFGFHVDKYTVYFSDRDGEWGFEELRCIKDELGDDRYIRLPIDGSSMPKWFNDSEKE